MMAPDYALVAEVMLFSEGFSGARRLAAKMTALYRVASEQLSRQVRPRAREGPCQLVGVRSWMACCRACADDELALHIES